MCSTCRGSGLVMSSYYGSGSRKVWLDYVNCRGSEDSLVYCSHSHWGVLPRYYWHRGDVSIYCREGLFALQRVFTDKLNERKEEYLYSAILVCHTRKTLRHGSHTCKLHHACLSFVSVHQMAPPLLEVPGIQLQLTSHLSTRRDERLRWPGWLTYSGRFTHISGHPSAAGRAQDREVRRPKTDVIPLCHATNSSTSLLYLRAFKCLYL